MDAARMTALDWMSIALPLGGTAIACLALLLPRRWRLVGGPMSVPLWESGHASTLLLLFTGLVLASHQVDPIGEWASLRLGLDIGSTTGLLVLACLPALRTPERGWGRAGFGPLTAAAAPWLLLLVVSVAIFRIVLLSYVPCHCPGLNPADLGWARVAASAAFAGLLAPLTEEVLYRGIALPLIGARAGGKTGVVLVAVAWAMAHGERPLLPLVVLGIALGKLTLGTGSLWASTGFHVAWNGTVVAYEIYSRVIGVDGKALSGVVIFFAVVGLVLAWVRLLDAARAGCVWITPI